MVAAQRTGCYKIRMDGYEWLAQRSMMRARLVRLCESQAYFAYLPPQWRVATLSIY